MSSLRRFKKWYRGWTGRNITTDEAREIIARAPHYEPGFSALDRFAHRWRYTIKPFLMRLFFGVKGKA